MNEQSSTLNDQNGTQPHEEQNTGRQSTSAGFFDSIGSAFRQGAEDAKAAAEQAIPHIKSAANDLAYWTSYGIAFAAAFQWALAKQITPDSVKAGFEEGLKSGKQAADRWAENLRRPSTASAEPSPAAEPQTPGAPQPGMV